MDWISLAFAVLGLGIMFTVFLLSRPITWNNYLGTGSALFGVGLCAWVSVSWLQLKHQYNVTDIAAMNKADLEDKLAFAKTIEERQEIRREFKSQHPEDDP